MLRVFDGPPISRRQLLTVGGLALGGLSLPTLFAPRLDADDRNRHLTGKSVIFLFQQGGPSQFETFDPKVDAPESTRTVTGVTRTKVPGVIFGNTLVELAKRMDKLAIVRSYQTGNGGHNIQPIVGPDSLDANIGVHYARVAGTTHPTTGMPRHAVIFPRAVVEDVPGPSARGNLAATGPYGSAYAPFVPGKGGQLQDNMQLRLPPGRFFDDRLALLNELDRMNRRVDASGQLDALDDIQQQACRVLRSGGVARALDLSYEDPATVARYDTSRFVAADDWSQAARGRRGYYTAQAKSIGKLLLLARRLCEAGCGFVTIHAGYAGVWDMHADGNNLNMRDGMEAVGRSFDHGVAALIDDLEERGLRDRIMLVATGEMGRTPRINKRGGRDHWARLAPLMIYGGGVRGGQVIGQLTRDGGQPATDNLTPKHLISTILHTVFDVTQLRLRSGVPSTVTQLTQHPTIPGLL